MNPIQTPAPITIVTLPATILTRAMVSALSACALTAELREAVSDALEEPFPGEDDYTDQGGLTRSAIFARSVIIRHLIDRGLASLTAA